MQPTNMYNNQNGMGQQVGYPDQQGYPQGMRGNPNGYPQNAGYVQEMNYSGPTQRSYPSASPWESQNWREVQGAQQTQMYIPFRGMSISDPSEIKPKDIPMDGHMSFFPMNDYSCIYAKVWTDDGRLRTFRFIPEIEQAPTEAPQSEGFNPKELADSVIAPMEKKLGSFDKRFDKIEKSISSVLDQLTPKENTKEAAKK